MKRPGSTFEILFDTFAGATGASITMTGLAVTDIEIYKNGSVTQRASDTGYTLLDTDGIDFDGLTGIHGIQIDLSSNADSGFFVCGGRYYVVVSAISVDSQTVSFVAGYFEIGYENAIINTTIATLSTQTSFTLTSGPAEDDALNGCVVCIHDIASGVQLGFGLVSDYTGSTKTVTLAAGVTFTAAAGDNISIFPPRPQLDNATYGLSALKTLIDAVDDFIDTEIAAIKAKTDNLPTDPADESSIQATLATIAAYIDTEVAAIKAKTDNLPTDPADESSIQATLATIAAYIDTEVAAIKAKTDNLPASPAAVSDIPTANANADALLDRANAIETGWTPRMILRLIAAALAGKLSGAATTNILIRDLLDTKNRINATVDANGNRTAVTLDGS